MSRSAPSALRLLVGTSTRWPALVLVAWLLVAGGLNLAIPQLESVVEKDSTPVVPAHAPSAVTQRQMDATFGDGGTRSTVTAVFVRKAGLTDTDRRYVTRVAAELSADREHITSVQAVHQRPELLRSLTSADGQAVYFQVGLPGATGAPTSIAQIERVRDVVEANPPEGLAVSVTGPPATISDLFLDIEHNLALITVATVVLIAAILLVIYRSVGVTVLILGQIGISLAVGRALSAFCGEHVFAVSTFTGSLLTVVVLGAATDYSVFLVSRFHEARRAGIPVREAAHVAGERIGGVVVGSGLTVIVASSAMLFADVGMFRTTGPAIAVGIAATLLIGLTLTPASMVLAGERGWLEPKAVRRERAWQIVGEQIVRRPGAVLAAGLVVLVGFGSLSPALVASVDERAHQTPESESNQGYALLDAHYPADHTLPEYLVLTADHDLRNVQDLAALELAAKAIAETPGVRTVQGITRPVGEPLGDASVGYPVGVVGTQLDRARRKLADQGGLDKMNQAVQQLAAGSGRVDQGARQAAAGTGALASGAGAASHGAGQLDAGSRALVRGMRALTEGGSRSRAGADLVARGADQLARGLDDARGRASQGVDGLRDVLAALHASPGCQVDPVCRAGRAGLERIYTAQRHELLPGLGRAASAAHRISDGSAKLENGLTDLVAGLRRATGGADRLADGQAALSGALSRIAAGAQRLNHGTTALVEGTDVLATGARLTAEGAMHADASLAGLEKGLQAAVKVLRETAAAAKDPSVGGFYLPPEALADSRLDLAARIFVSGDGRTARFVVVTHGNAFGPESVDQADAIAGAARTALRGTGLADADLATTGVRSTNRDVLEESWDDLLLIAGLALLAVLLILVSMLRSLVAPVFLLASVVLSYAAALGIGILVWQVVLDQPLDWTVPATTFVLLVAVGADYNLLLMKRIHESAPNGERVGIAEAVRTTGSVITTAGIIFAASMFALMTGSATNLSQLGFTIGIGLLLDTFVVRSLVVPAVAALLGPALWWPSRSPQPEGSA